MKFRKSNIRRGKQSKTSIQHHAQTPAVDETVAKPTAKSSFHMHIHRLLRTKKVLVAVIAVLIVVLIVAVQRPPASSRSARAAENIKVPEYQAFLPTNKSIDELGGWKRISPKENDPVYAYNDSLSDIAISVSQQQLPQSFIGHAADRVAELAKSYNATTTFDAGDTSVFVGTSAKGPQSVIFTKDNLLVLIKSQKKIDNELWTKYVTSLELTQPDAIPKY